jgi:hypothetical protein
VASRRGGRSVKMVVPEASAAKSEVASPYLRGCHHQIGVGHHQVENLHPFTQPDLSMMWSLLGFKSKGLNPEHGGMRMDSGV